ncbi:MAG TPA: cupin domain-containing protein [Microbacterium sp.]|nr:cupin domain-containing protein [Microbacterium sp.]
MVDILDIERFIIGGTRTAKYEGEPYGSQTSFFLVDNQPGQGPGLHWHPYPETWVVLEGRARFVAGDEEFEAGQGAILTVPAEVHHKFTALTHLRMFCTHPVERMIQYDLE